jgi:predicted metal-binding membrane protein
MAVDMYGPMTGPSAWMMTAYWDWVHIALLFAMWSAMMVAMMLPSAIPMLVQCAKSIAGEPDSARPLFGIGAFAAGYVFVWTLFSAAATMAQRALSEAELLTPMMEPATPAVASGLLLAAGVYQLLPFKRRCLFFCRSVAACIRQPPKAVFDAFRMGTQHGLWCLGCCGALMLLLFAGGVMNLLVIAALTLIVIIEKVAPFGMQSTQVSGALLIGLGIWTMAHAH